MTPLAVEAKCGSGNVRLVRVDRNELDAGLGDEQIEVPNTIRTVPGLDHHRRLENDATDTTRLSAASMASLNALRSGSS